jgi:hypothetical protein
MVQRVYEEADFCDVLELMPIEIRRSLTFEQRSAISAAVIKSRRRHAVDVRVGIPLLFTQLYLVFFMGKDTRRATQQRLIERRCGLGQWGMAAIVSLFGLLLTGTGLAAAYYVKSKSGINLFSDMHAKDFIRGFGVW